VALVEALPEDDEPLPLLVMAESSFVVPVVPSQAARNATEKIRSSRELSPFRMTCLLLGLWAFYRRVAIVVANSGNGMAVSNLLRNPGFPLRAA
jgi:hypothetical protein